MTASRVAAVLMLVLAGSVTANWLTRWPKAPAGLSEWAMHAVEGKLGYRVTNEPGQSDSQTSEEIDHVE